MMCMLYPSYSFSQLGRITDYDRREIKKSKVIEIKERKARYDSVWYERKKNWPDTTFEFHFLYDTIGNLIEKRWELSDNGSIYDANSYTYNDQNLVVGIRLCGTRKGGGILSGVYYPQSKSNCEFYQNGLLKSEHFRFDDDIFFLYYKYNGRLLDKVTTFKNAEIWSIDLIEYIYQE